ncbi:MAG: acyloxyacyl hydrolase [Bacteroidota bacterium]
MSTAIDVNLVWQTYGRKDWHQRRNFPLLGLGITYTDYGADAVFGKCIGIYPNIQIPLIRRSKFEWTLRIGDGIGYVTRKYQTEPPINVVNTAISTHINDFAMFMTDIRYHVNQHWDVQVGGNFTHISNALFKEPNLGINMYGAHVAIRYFPVTSTPGRILKDLPKLSNRWLVQVRAGIAFNQSRSPGNPQLPTYLGSLYASRRWKSKNKMFFGTDFSFHESNYAALRYWQIYQGKEWGQSWYGAFFVGNEFLLGRVGVITQVGVYYHQIYLKHDPYYQKLGGNLYLVRRERGALKELFISCLLKTHKMTAELAEFGIGCGF